ncbi:Protein kinase of the Mitotic Exit Network [Balamuthia mandrillaris]
MHGGGGMPPLALGSSSSAPSTPVHQRSRRAMTDVEALVGPLSPRGATRQQQQQLKKNRRHSKKPSMTLADLDYDDKFSTVSMRGQKGAMTVVLGQYQLLERVGKGAFGIVFKALDMQTTEYIAIKRLKKEGIDEAMLINLKGEIDLLKALDHPNIVKYLGLVESDNHVNMLLEFVQNGSLLKIIQKYGVFPEQLAALHTSQVLKGLQYLHKMNVIHRDIKASNLLINKDGVVKLADFGIAIDANAEGSGDAAVASSFVEGSPYWMAPEIIELHPPTTACDIWSLGCTIIELVTGQPPNFEIPSMSALFKIVQDDCPPIPDTLSPELQDFLRRCFHKDPTKRPTATELMKHPWLKEGALNFNEALGTVRQYNKKRRSGAGEDESGSGTSEGSSSSSGKGSIRGALTSIDWNLSEPTDLFTRSEPSTPLMERGGSARGVKKTSAEDSSSPTNNHSNEKEKGKSRSLRVRDISRKFEDICIKESQSYIVLITGYEIRKNKLFTYTVYRLRITFSKQTWTVFKTYSDFKGLHSHLKVLTRKRKFKTELPKFPGTKLFGAEKDNYVKKRKNKLQLYINQLLDNPQVMKTGLLTNFLKEDGEDVRNQQFVITSSSSSSSENILEHDSSINNTV